MLVIYMYQGKLQAWKAKPRLILLIQAGLMKNTMLKIHIKRQFTIQTVIEQLHPEIFQ